MTMTTKNQAAQSLRAIPSEKRSEASRSNGAKGGRPASEMSWQVGRFLFVLSPEPLECFGAKRRYWLTGTEVSSNLRRYDEIFDRNFGRCEGVISEMGNGIEDPEWYVKAPAAAKRILRRFYTR